MVVKTHQKEDVYKNSFPEEKFNKELNVWNTKVSKSKNFIESYNWREILVDFCNNEKKNKKMIHKIIKEML